MSIGFRRKFLMSIGALAVACAMPVYALDVGSVKVPETVTVGGKALVLNGAGQRQIFVIKVYVAALYVEKKSTSAAEILAATGPKRVTLYVQREIDSDEFGQLLITSMNKNSTKEEKAKVVSQTTKFGEIFADQGIVKKGDVTTLDWIPGKGTLVSVNGKPIGDYLPDLAFNQAVMRIWLGGNPPQANLKSAMLGEK